MQVTIQMHVLIQLKPVIIARKLLRVIKRLITLQYLILHSLKVFNLLILHLMPQIYRQIILHRLEQYKYILVKTPTRITPQIPEQYPLYPKNILLQPQILTRTR